MLKIQRLHDEPLWLEDEYLKAKEIKKLVLHRCLLNRLDFSNFRFYEIDFRSAEMYNSRFISALFYKSKLIMVKAGGSTFDKSNFKESLVLHSDFTGSSFKQVNFSEIILNNVNFSECDFRGANLQCEGLNTCRFVVAIYDDNTQWNVKFDVLNCGAMKVNELQK